MKLQELVSFPTRLLTLLCILVIFCGQNLADGLGCDCNNKGTCTPYGTCQCYKGWEGVRCTKRSCPTGASIADIARSSDNAHSPAVCSGQGMCDHSTGQCLCSPGFEGYNCGKFSCPNQCSGNGQCISLRTAATFYDGNLFNRTTTYDQWDADIIHGCKCDPGWEGYDCSQRSCEYGLDPRLTSSSNYETVTFVCSCGSQGCSGKFKLSFMGAAAKSWLNPTSTATDMATSFMSISSVIGSNTAQSFVPVTPLSSGSSVICATSATTKTSIKFQRKSLNEVPVASLYANLIQGGSIYFETQQTLSCDCTHFKYCNGTFFLSFDGQVSSRLYSWHNSSSIVKALNAMATIQAGGITVSMDSVSAASPVCSPGMKRDHVVYFQAASGNIPRVVFFGSVDSFSSPLSTTYRYMSGNASNTLTMSSTDGRDSSLKLCNGIGKCDHNTGTCICPPGWVFDPDLGPCGIYNVSTSEWGGISRCPGLIDAVTGDDLSSKGNYGSRLYLSLNPVDLSIGGGIVHKNDKILSTIEYFQYTSDPYPDIKREGVVFLNLTSNSSAGPLIIDSGKNQLFFVDANPKAPFIGFASMDTAPSTYSIFLTLTSSVFGFACDARPNQRKLFWTIPRTPFANDGGIFWAYMDILPATAYSLTSTIGQSYVTDPMGIAIHMIESRIYWIDKKITDAQTKQSVLRSCKTDGTDFTEVYVYKAVGNHTVSTNATDLVIDFSRNNTAFFVDSSTSGSAIISTNLDFPSYPKNISDPSKFTYFHNTRLICDNWQELMGTPTYLTLDDSHSIMMWSDTQFMRVRANWYMDTHVLENSFFSNTALIKNPTGMLQSFGTDYKAYEAYHGYQDPQTGADFFVKPVVPVGIALDNGLGGSIKFGNYKECFGNGKCSGISGNFVCQCNDGYYGNCQSRTCPRGLAWFHEPAVDNVAHDEYIECSNKGTCDRLRGICNCQPGFEGSACERMTCGALNKCNGRGRCLSMRDLAAKRKNNLKEPDPTIYGMYPFNPSTWDADRIFGCAADEHGYIDDEFGYHNVSAFQDLDLVSRSCAFGPFPLTNVTGIKGLLHNHTFANEIQIMYCNAPVGYFTLIFRGDISSQIPINSTAYEFQRLLQSIPSLGSTQIKIVNDAGLDISSSSTICTSQPHHVEITFLSETGAKPLLSVYSSQFLGRRRASVSFKRLVTARSDALLECSGMGDCDRDTGSCKCLPLWGSTDGNGKSGHRGDCGIRLY